jgi:ribosome-associated protein
MKKAKVNFLQLAKAAANIADEKKATDIVILNVISQTTIADYFVIATAESTPQMNAIIQAIHSDFKQERGLSPLHVEGKDSPSWSVIDYGGLVVHIMSPQTRALFSLERIWSEARKVSPAAPKKKATTAKKGK